MSVAPAPRPGLALRWQSFEAWVGTRSSAAALFVLALAVFALQSVVLPGYPGRDMGRYVQTFIQLWFEEPVLPSVMNTRGPLAALGVGVPLELGGAAAEVWLALLYAASIVAWGAVALKFGPRAAILATALLLGYPGYGILFHGLAGDALFAAAFAGWAVLLTRAVVSPSNWAFAFAGLGMGALVLVRPSNVVLIAMVLLPLALRARWSRRLAWMASFFIGFAAVTQGWKALAELRYSEAVTLTPNRAVLVAALALSLFLLPAAWGRRLALVAIPLVIVAVAVRASSGEGPIENIRSVSQSPSMAIFLFRAYEIDRIVSPDNGPVSRELAQVVQRDLLTQEPYRSYGIDLNEFFSSGSDRMFADLTSFAGVVDLEAVTREAIRSHPGTFVTSIGRTVWQLLSTRRVFAPEVVQGEDQSRESTAGGEGAFIVVNGRKLPKPSDGQPIPASRTGPILRTLRGQAREVWRSPTEHPLVFDDPRDERRYEDFERDTARLLERIPTRDANDGLVHRLNQASRAFPPPAFWLSVGLVALATRRPRRILAAVAPSVAALVVIVTTSLVAFSVAEYAGPVSPAFVVLAAVGVVGAHPRGRLRLSSSRRRRPR